MTLWWMFVIGDAQMEGAREVLGAVEVVAVVGEYKKATCAVAVVVALVDNVVVRPCCY